MKPKIIKSIGLEHPSVRRVIEIAEEIMDKNKVLNIDTLYNVSKKELKIPRNGLLFIIQFLINNKILIEGSKFSKKTVLSNPIRYAIYRFIDLNPGVHFSELRKRSISGENMSSGQLIWHLGMLMKFNFIRKIKVGNYSVFIPYGMDEENGKIFFLIRDRIIYKLLTLLIEREVLVKAEIYKILDEKREKVYYRVKNLMDLDIIAMNKDSDREIVFRSNKKKSIIKILKSPKIYF